MERPYWPGGWPAASRGAADQREFERLGCRDSAVIIYLGTSAWIKLCVREIGSKELRACAIKAAVMATSAVAYPEARAAFARLRVQGTSTKAKHQQRLAQLNLD